MSRKIFTAVVSQPGGGREGVGGTERDRGRG